MAVKVIMPSLGQTTDELRIVCWRKQEGEFVHQGEVLLEVETDKAQVEVEAFISGVLLKILCSEGEVVRAGSVIAIIAQPGEEIKEVPSLSRKAAPTRSEERVMLESVGEPSGLERRRFKKVLASPAARKLATSERVDIASVAGSGPGGRIEKEDVLAYLAGRDRTSAIVSPARRALAEKLSRSFREVPHIYIEARVDVSRCQERMAQAQKDEGTRVTYTHVILQAVAHALREHPEMNRLWVDEEIRVLSRADVGLAVAAEDGLLVVTIPEPDRKALPELVAHVEQAVSRARHGRLRESDLAECATTTSNLGMFDVEAFAGVINAPQSSLLAVGKVIEEPVVREKQVVVRPLVYMTLSADHRLIDGALAGQFLASIRRHLESL